MKRPLASNRPIGPFADLIGNTETGSDPAKQFEGSFDSFTIILEYNIVTSEPVDESEIRSQASDLETVLNDYLFSGEGADDIIYFMRSNSNPDNNASYQLSFAVDGDIWEGRLGSEGKYEGSLGGTEDAVDEELGIGTAVESSYLHIYPTEKAKEVQQTGGMD